jgi:TorA maturation chaperone TorD
MIDPEEAARANFYGLIARLFYAPPDAQLLSRLLQAGPMALEAERNAQAEALAAAWSEMLEACRGAEREALEGEHTELFVGTGKAAVTPYLSHYVLRHSNDSPLVDLRGQLSAWGIARREDVPEYEDHVSGVCETMRFLIAVQQRPPEDQQAFFARFVYRGITAFCDAVTTSRQARFYRPVARFARTFREVEKSAFEMVG